MKGISAVIVTLNEADRIEACLDLLDFCDEIVIVDSGSTDGTLEIVKRYTDKIEHRDWTGFKDQKEFAISLANGPWILELDADEIISSELARQIKSIQDSTTTEGFIIRRDLYFMGRLMKYGSTPDRILRLYRKDKVTFHGSDTHPYTVVGGPVEKLEGSLKHYSYRNLEDYFIRFNKYTSEGARDRFDSGVRFSFFQNFRFFYEFIMRYFIRLGFMDGYPGFVYALNSSFYAWTKYAKLKELENECAKPS